MSLRSGFVGKPTIPTWPEAIILTGTMTAGHLRAQWQLARSAHMEASFAPGTTQLGIMKQIFLTRKEWWYLVPDQSVFALGGNVVGKALNLAARHKDAQWIIVYLGAKASISIDMNTITAGKRVDAFWVDLRTGQGGTGWSVSKYGRYHSCRRTGGKTRY